MEYGNLGGLFDGSMVLNRSGGNMAQISLAGENSGTFKDHSCPLGWGDYIYATGLNNSSSGSWLRYNTLTDDLEVLPSYGYGRAENLVTVNNDQSGRIHYMVSRESTYGKAGILDLEAKTLTWLSNCPYMDKTKVATWYNGFLYSVNTAWGTALTLNKFDIEANMNTVIKLTNPINIPSSSTIRSFTPDGKGNFYMTMASVQVGTSPAPNTSVSILKWNEASGTLTLIAQDIPIEYKYPNMEYQPHMRQHYTAQHSFLENNRIYFCMLGATSASYMYAMWAVIDLNLKKYTILSLEDRARDMSVTRTDTGVYYMAYISWRAWNKIYFQIE